MRAWSLFNGGYQRAIERADRPALTAAAATMPRQVGPASVLSDQSTLSTIVWSDLTQQTADVLDRDGAMGIPALARQRHLLCGTVARCQLTRVDATGRPEADQPLWATRTDRLVSPYHRMLWTMDDLLFYGWSLWRCERGWSAGGVGELLAVEHIDQSRWQADEVGRIFVDGRGVSEGEVIAIPGPHEGILNFGKGALRRTIDNLDSAANAARNPSAYLNLQYTGDDQMTDDDIDALIARWAKARRGENGGVAYTNKWVNVSELGTHEAHLLIEGRNADAVDVSRLVSSPAAMADATNAGASLTYETSQGRNGEFIDYGVGLYMDAVAARLSLTDVVPGNGSRMVFDTTEIRTLTPSATDSDRAGGGSTPTPGTAVPTSTEAPL